MNSVVIKHKGQEITITEQDMRDKMKQDAAYQNNRENAGQSKGRNAYPIVEMWSDLARVAKNTKETELEELTGKQYANSEDAAFSRPGQEKRNGSWSLARAYAVLAVKAGVIKTNGGVSGMAVLKDMRQVAIYLNKNVLELTSKEYEKHGAFARSTVYSYYGAWKDAKDKAFDSFVNHDWDDIR